MVMYLAIYCVANSLWIEWFSRNALLLYGVFVIETREIILERNLIFFL